MCGSQPLKTHRTDRRTLLVQRIVEARAVIGDLRLQRADEWEITVSALHLWQSIADMTDGDEPLRRYAFAEFDRMLQSEGI